MSTLATADSDGGSIYATFWRMVYMSVHRHDSSPTGELLTVMTLALLGEAGHRATVSELVELTGLPKSSVARYISRQIKKGFISEVVDSEDRRRRKLTPTEKGRQEEQRIRKHVQEVARLTGTALRGKGESRDPVADLKKILLEINEEPIPS